MIRKKEEKKQRGYNKSGKEYGASGHGDISGFVR